MKAPMAITYKESFTHPDKLTNLKTTDQHDFQFKVEEHAEKIAPLPTTFDIASIQDPYFSEYTYFNVFAGLVYGSMSAEVNTRILAGINEDMREWTPGDHIEHIRSNHKDKYELQTIEDTYKRVIFLPGTNLFRVIDKNKLRELLFKDPTIMVKPHPISHPDGIYEIAQVAGWHRIIPPEWSGYELLQGAEEIWYTANSELGIIAAALDKPAYDFTWIGNAAICPYYPMYHNFKDGDPESNRAAFNRILSDDRSGWIMPWMEDWEDRLKSFFDISMRIRGFFKPFAPPLLPPCECQ